MSANKVYDIDDWCEEYGEVLLLHFYSDTEPPLTTVSSPTELIISIHGVGYWTHFMILDFQHIRAQARRISDKHKPKSKLL